MTSSHYICCYNENRELEHFKVPKPISVYIRQLECEIKYGRGGVQKLYPFRFDGKFDVEDWKKKPPYDEGEEWDFWEILSGEWSAYE